MTEGTVFFTGMLEITVAAVVEASLAWTACVSALFEAAILARSLGWAGETAGVWPAVKLTTPPIWRNSNTQAAIAPMNLNEHRPRERPEDHLERDRFGIRPELHSCQRRPRSTDSCPQATPTIAPKSFSAHRRVVAKCIQAGIGSAVAG